MKTYYIVETVDRDGDLRWCAHGHGILSMLNIFNIWNMISETYSWRGPDQCEARLRRILHPVKPKVVRVVRI